MVENRILSADKILEEANKPQNIGGRKAMATVSHDGAGLGQRLGCWCSQLVLELLEPVDDAPCCWARSFC